MKMATNDQKLKLYERVQKISRWIGIDEELRNDLANEAWISLLDYAAKQQKDLGNISTTEIKYRCLEAARNVRQNNKEKSVESELLIGTSDERANEMIQIEDVHSLQNSALARDAKSIGIDNINWILQNHPKLRLTDHQWNLLRISQNKNGRWKADYAREHKVTRQNISKTTQIIAKKVEAAIDLLNLINGDVDQFFQKYASGFFSGNPLRNVLWSIFRPPKGTKVKEQLWDSILPLQQLLLDKATQVILQENRRIAMGQSPDPRQLAVGYNLFYTGVYSNIKNNKGAIKLTESVNNLMATTKKSNFKMMNIAVMGGFSSSSSSLFDQYKEWLKNETLHHDSEGLRSVNYFLAYYDGASVNDYLKILNTDGRNRVHNINYALMVKRLYENLKNTWYDDSNLQDMNYIKLLLLFSYFPPQFSKLPQYTLNSVLTLSQKALHSKDLFVIQEAKKVLSSISPHKIISRV